jgi:hypothetical protein
MILPTKLQRKLSSDSAIRCCLAVCLLLLARSAHGAPEYEVKAAQTAKFASYIEWPSASRGGALVIGLVGRDPSAGGIERALSGANVSGRRVELRRVAPGDTAGLRDCNIIFVSGTEEERAGEIIRQVQGYPVLTVGETGSFLALGGMLQFITVDGQIRFEANPRAAERSGLKLTSGLLRIARRVVGG